MPTFTGTGTIERRGDADWFAVQLTGGQAYSVGSNADFVSLAFRGPFGDSLASPFATASGFNFVAPYSGRFFIEARSVTLTGPYTVTLTSGPSDGIAGNSWTNASLAVGATFTPPTVAGAIRDPDWFAVDLMGGQSYNATVTSGSVYIADATGKLIEFDGGSNVQFSPLFGGRYYVAVDNASPGYSVAINPVVDDYADNITTVGRITPGTNASGTTNVRGDEDWFQVQLDATQTYGFSFGTTSPLTISMRDASGNLLGTDLQYFQAQRSGTYYVEVATAAPSPYQIGLNPVAGGILGNTYTDQRLVPTDSPRGAQLQGRGDEDWYRVDLVGGQSYTLATANGGGLTIQLLDAGGNPVFGLPTGDIRSFTPASTGTYYLAFGTTNLTLTTYFTAVDPYADDFAANFLGAGRISPDTLVTANFEAHDDRDWFAIDLRSNTSYFLDSAVSVRLLDANFQPVTTTLGDNAFTPQFNGLYYVEAVTTTQTGSYSFAVRSFADDYVDNNSTTGRLVQGGVTPPPPPGGGSTAPTAGDDSVTGSAGSDTIDALAGNDTIRGLGGNDVLAGGLGNDVIDGGDGSDFVDFSGATGNTVVNLSLGGAQNTGQGSDTLISIENVRGGAGSDQYYGNEAANVLEDRIGGNDTLVGNGGDDILTIFRNPTIVVARYAIDGGEGNDTISVTGNGGSDDATILGGAGADTIDLRELANVTVDAGPGDDSVRIDVRTGNYSVTLGQGNDTLVVFDRGMGPRVAGQIGVTDFRGGDVTNGGDFLDLRQYLLGVFPTYSPTADPFADGRLRLLDGPAGVQVQVDLDGAGPAYGFQTLATLSGVLTGSTVRGNILTNYTTGGISTTPTVGDDSITGSAGADTIDALAGNDTIRGLGGNDVLTGGIGNDLIDGGDGSDFADFSGLSTGANVNLANAGAQNSGQGTDTFVSIENLRGGAGGDVFAGDENANILEDRVGGNDNLIGNGGDDTLILYRAATDGPGLAYVVRGGEGNDTIAVDGNGGSDLAGIEGNAGDDVIDLRDLGNTTVDAGAGTDRVTIDVRTGNYTVTLGTGSDTIIPVDRGAVPRLTGAIRVTDFQTGAGGDVVDLRPYLTAIFPTYAAGSDPFADGRLQIVGDETGSFIRIDRDGTGTAFGFQTLLSLTGAGPLTAANFLIGSGTTPGDGVNAPVTVVDSGNANSLTSAGGSTILIGLGGDDTYTVTSTQVLLIEAPNEGNDVAVVTLGGTNFVLNGNSSVETVRAAPGTDPINITGSPSAQTILGNDGANILSAGGFVGDTIAGGLGDDTYRVFGGLDQIVEAAGQGNDSVFVSGNSFMLNPGASVEFVSVASHADTGSFYLVGNEVSQIVVGNYGDNILDGNAGTTGNADTLIGLFGNDIYRVYGQNDQIQETAGQGIDSVFTSGDFQLRTGLSIELLSAADHSANSATVRYTLRGNEIGQTIIGNDAANTLDGRSGNDNLLGRGGADVFAFTTAPGSGNVDTILDFVSGTDRIGLASDVYAALAGGVAPGNFLVGTGTVQDSDDRLLYDQTTGRLFYDADGSGAGPSILFAQLGAWTLLTAADFVVIAPVADIG